MLCLVSNHYNYGTSGSNTASSIYFININTTIIMIYFYNSSRKSDKLSHPITISTNGSERRAYALAVINFLKNGLKGSPKLVRV